MYVGCFRLIEFEIRTATDPSHGDAQLVQLERQALRGALDHGDCDCYALLRRDLRDFVSAWLARAACAAKIGSCVRIGCSQHWRSTSYFMILARRGTQKSTRRSLRKLWGVHRAPFWSFSAFG